MADDRRLELRVSGEFLERLDAARGVEPRASWIKRTVDMALDDAGEVHIEPLDPLAEFGVERGS